MQGGTAQGIGWALHEEYTYTADGVMTNPTFLDYRMPTPGAILEALQAQETAT